MSNSTPSESIFQKPASQFNARLPHYTHAQINQLAATHGLTKTQVIIVAVDRLARGLAAESESETTTPQKDIRRLKTVARILPKYDLGQEE